MKNNTNEEDFLSEDEDNTFKSPNPQKDSLIPSNPNSHFNASSEVSFSSPTKFVSLDESIERALKLKSSYEKLNSQLDKN